MIMTIFRSEKRRLPRTIQQTSLQAYVLTCFQEENPSNEKEERKKEKKRKGKERIGEERRGEERRGEERRGEEERCAENTREGGLEREKVYCVSCTGGAERDGRVNRERR
jgi:hypothetical protein